MDQNNSETGCQKGATAVGGATTGGGGGFEGYISGGGVGGVGAVGCSSSVVITCVVACGHPVTADGVACGGAGAPDFGNHHYTPLRIKAIEA